MQAKSKGAPVVEDPDPKGLRAPERRIDIQPAEDEEDPGTVFESNSFHYCIKLYNIRWSVEAYPVLKLEKEKHIHLHTYD